MSIFVIGVNHRTAPLALREQVYFAPDRQGLYLQDLIQRELAHEAVLLSTCNRSELYVDADEVQTVLDWFVAQTTLPEATLLPLLDIHQDEGAIVHLMSVACGLDSMVLGEPQILGQLKTAYSESCSAGCVGPLFHRLFQAVFNVAKEIRSTTAIGACPVSVATAAIHFAKQRGVDVETSRVLLMGAGDTTALLARYLKPLTAHPLQFVNRSLDKAVALAQQFGGEAHPLDALPNALAEATLVFTATGSALPLITHEMMQHVKRLRNGGMQTFIDLAVPRDIEASVAHLDEVDLYCIDDLMSIIHEHRQGRAHAAEKARDLIQTRCQDFLREQQLHTNATGTIRAYRGQVEAICQREMAKARDYLQAGVDPETVLAMFAKAYTRKLLHAPSVQLRQAGAEGRFELLQVAKQLFSLTDPEVGLS